MRIIIHTGQQKTASSSIQSQLSKLRKTLQARRVLYSTAFGITKAKDLGDALRGRAKAGKNYAKSFADFATELTGDWDTIILSQENLYRLKPDHMRKLFDLTAIQGIKPEIYTYIRRPDEHLSSFYQQKVQGFKDRSIDEFIGDCVDNGYYAFSRKFNEWARVFGQDNVKARLFHREVVRKPPVEDFLDWIGVDVVGLRFPPEEQANTNAALDTTLIEVARGITRYSFQFPDKLSSEFVFEFRRAFRDFSSGEKLAISQAQAERICELTRDECEAFADRYLSATEKRLLLAPPRLTDATELPAVDDVVFKTLLLLNSLRERLPATTDEGDLAIPDDRIAAGLLRGCLDRARARLADLPIAALVSFVIARLAAFAEEPAEADPDEAARTSAFVLLIDLMISAGYDVGPSASSTTNVETLAQRDRKLQKKRRGNARLVERDA